MSVQMATRDSDTTPRGGPLTIAGPGDPRAHPGPDPAAPEIITTKSLSHMTVAPTELLRRVLIGGNHLATIIGVDHPLHTASSDDALEHYGVGHRYDAWIAWRAIMELSRAISI